MNPLWVLHTDMHIKETYVNIKTTALTSEQNILQAIIPSLQLKFFKNPTIVKL